MAYPQITLNDTGIQRLRQFFGDFHVQGEAHLTPPVLEDLVNEIENAYVDQYEARLELKPWDCTLGTAKELVLEPECWDPFDWDED